MRSTRCGRAETRPHRAESGWGFAVVGTLETVFLVVPLDTTGGVHDLLVAGVERVRLRRHVDRRQRILGAIVHAGIAGVDARLGQELETVGNVPEHDKAVLGVDVRLHEALLGGSTASWPNRRNVFITRLRALVNLVGGVELTGRGSRFRGEFWRLSVQGGGEIEKDGRVLYDIASESGTELNKCRGFVGIQ